MDILHLFPEEGRERNPDKMKRAIKVIAWVGGGHSGADAQILRGLHLYARPHKPWVFHDYSRQGDDPRQWKRAATLDPDIVVAHILHPQLAEDLQAWGGPVINISNVMPDLPFPQVWVDDRAIGAMAADYLYERSFRHFGFLGHPGWLFSEERLRGYADRLRLRGSIVHVHTPPKPFARGTLCRKMLEVRIAWLQSLPKPIAIFTSLDSLGREVCEACRQTGIRVPEDVAVLGVDNYDLICEMSWPPLSSIITPYDQVGFEIGRMIERTFQGHKLPLTPTVFKPIAVVTRQSTDIVSTEDPELAAALRFLHEHITEHINVSDVLEHVAINRVALFRKFKRIIGRSPLQEIQRLRCELARRLLAGSDLPMPQVAQACGYRDAAHMSVLFRRQTGQTPTSWRRTTRPQHPHG
jgi:LacI family transcriptional regulator